MVGVAHDERAEPDPALAPAQDRVPHRRRVARALDAQPRPRRRVAAGADAVGDEPMLRRDRAVRRVDEEDAHASREASVQGAAPRASNHDHVDAATHARPATSPAWRVALLRFDEDLRRRGSAAKTREAYGIDLRDFAAWASGREARARRRHAPDPAPLRRRRCRSAATRPATVARKLAALRAFFGMLREHGEIEANPADLLAAPKLASELPTRARARADQPAAGPHPGVDAARAARPRALRGRLRERPARGGARRARPRLGRLRRRAAARRGQGLQDAHGPGRRARAQGARALPRARPRRRSRGARTSPRCFSRSPAGGCRRRTSGGA